MILVIGPLAHPLMVATFNLTGERIALAGSLHGGTRAGIDKDAWPQLRPGSGSVAAMRVEWTPELRRYAEVFDLHPVETSAGPALGLGSGIGPEGQWHSALAVAIAQALIRSDKPVALLRSRLGQIGVWMNSRLRAKAEHPARLGPSDSEWQILDSAEPYAHYFAVEKLHLRHRLFSGGWSAELDRAIFVSGDATVLLPWDPVRDRVLLIDQFRAGPAARGDNEPWLLEAIAGRIDAGETPEEAARREATEEAGVTIERVFAAPSHYPSPGAVAEYLYIYIGTTDLPDDVTGVSGLDSEHEDIRSHLVDRAQLMALVERGEIRNGPLLVAALWLDRHAARLRGELGLSTASKP